MIAQSSTLSEPWSWLLGRQQPLASLDPLDGSGTPRLLFDARLKPPFVTLPSGQTSLPAASFPFCLLGGTRVQAFHFPTDSRHHGDQHDFPLTLLFPESSVEVHQIHVVSRPSEKRSHDHKERKLGHTVDAWIDWQVWAFQELGHLPRELSEFDAATHAATVRRTWDAASEVWFRDGSQKARTALIVRLCQEQPLRRALEAISRHPRRILQRYRENTPISRIQELDSACIREYARRPGISPVEKAGSLQRLLAVRRREQRDTLENRVACWVLERLVLRASAYCAENSGFPDDEKVERVSRFGRNASGWRTSEWLFNVAKLAQVVTQPNYPLQFEPRYQTAWKTYLRLLKEKREIDDAWAWQRVLWGETGRQLIGCYLQYFHRPTAVSTPFYRTELRHGCWTEPPIAPGPFQIKCITNGRLEQHDMLVFDSRDLDGESGFLRARWLDDPPFRGADYLGASGCDQILLLPKLNRALLVWNFYHSSLGTAQGGLDGILSRCGDSLASLTADLRRFAQSDLRLSGMLLVADLGRAVAKEARHDSPCVVLEPGPRLSGGGAVNALCIPPDVDAWPKFVVDFRAGFELVLEGFLK